MAGEWPAGRPAGSLARSLPAGAASEAAAWQVGAWETRAGPVPSARERALALALPQSGAPLAPFGGLEGGPEAKVRGAGRRRGGGKQRSPPLPGAPAWLGADPRVPGARSPGARLAPARSAFPLRVGPCWVRRRVCVGG